MPHFRTRNQLKFAYRPFSRLMIRKQSFLLQRAPKIFAKLPITAIKSSPVDDLKNELKNLPYDETLKY